MLHNFFEVIERTETIDRLSRYIDKNNNSASTSSNQRHRVCIRVVTLVFGLK